MPPSIGPPATVREVPNGGNACAHAPFGPPSRIPLHTFGPLASSEPSALKQESDAPAGLLPPTPSSGFALMFFTHSSRTSSACGVWSNRVPGWPGCGAAVNQISWFDASPS